MNDLRYTLRQIRKQPGFALTAVVVLALSIGGSTAVFSVLYQALLRPLPYPDADRLVFVHNVFPKRQVSSAGVSGYDYARVKRQTDVFSDAAVFFWNDLTLTGQGTARHINVVNASASLFTVLESKPSIGRTFAEGEDIRGAAPTAILSEDLWRSSFASDPNVSGKVIHLNGMPYTVIGVMPKSFQFPSHETQLWIPLDLPKGEFTIEGGRTEKWLHMLARLAPGVTPQRAEAALATISSQMSSTFPSFYPGKDGWRFGMRPLAEETTVNIRRWLYIAFGAVISVFLIACINVSGLLLIRGAARSGEIAIRMAIGAGKRRIVLQTLTETGVLVFLGCAGGLLLALWAVRLVNLYGPLPQPVPIHLWSVAFAIGIASLSTILIGLIPGWVTAGFPIEQALKSGATRSSTRGSGWRSAVVASQLALAIILVFTATQLNRSFLNLMNVPAGFNPQRVWSGALDLPSREYRADQSWNTKFFEPLLAQINSMPGVESASASNALPFNPSGVWTEELHLPETPVKHPAPEAQIGLVLPGYFETMRIPLLRGRTFSEKDRAGTPLAAVIDEELARRYLPGEDAVGKQIGSGGANQLARVVGIVGSVHNESLSGPHQPQVYYPELQERTESIYLVLRMKNDADPSAAVRDAIAKLDPGVALYDVKRMDDRVAESLKVRRFIAFVLSGLAAVGILLALIGLYGALSYLVELRTREIGIRLALGAVRTRIMTMIVGHAASIAASGLIAGIAGSLAAERAIRSQLFGIQLTDSAAWLGVFGTVVIASAIAAWLPAWRAARIEPTVALRQE